jgi:TRAP-type uncharacterized transport system fused permease subunit
LAITGIVSVIVVASLRRSTRLGPRALVQSLVTATIRMVPVTAACAAAGMVAGASA